MQRNQIRQLTSLSMLTALSYLVMIVCRLPLIPEMGFIKYDPKDILLVVTGFLFGPLPCIAVTLCVTLLEMLTVSSSGLIGFVMNLLASLAFTLPASLLYQRKRRIQTAIWGLLLGAVLMTLVMLLWNILLTPLYTGWPREQVLALLLPAILPFNLLKSGLNLSATLLLYQPLNHALRKAGLLESRKSNSQHSAPGSKQPSKAYYTCVALGAAFLLITLILTILAWKGVL